MDDGSEIQGLDEPWTFMGARLSEWCSGLAMGLIVSEFIPGNIGRSMPLMIGTIVGFPLILAAVRRQFPDEERGLRNYLCIVFGLKPPGLPAPAQFQPVWSGAPSRKLSTESQFSQLKLEDVFAVKEEQEG